MTDSALLKVWKAAWESTNGTNPFSAAINKQLMAAGTSTFEVHTRLGLIARKKDFERKPSERALLEFWSMVKLNAENVLKDKCADHTQGCMFLLETQYGYRRGQDISISAADEKTKTTRTWGVQVKDPDEGRFDEDGEPVAGGNVESEKPV